MNGTPSLPLVHGFRRSHLHEITQECQRIEEVALAGSIASDKDSQWLKLHIAEGDALVAPDSHPAKKWRFRPLVDLVDCIFAWYGRHIVILSGAKAIIHRLQA